MCSFLFLSHRADIKFAVRKATENESFPLYFILEYTAKLRAWSVMGYIATKLTGSILILKTLKFLYMVSK